MRVAWVHPTWRDLVIERLAADAAARRRFLSRCGVHGAVLALSVAGGAAGGRRLPLMVDDADWDALGDRLYALAPDADSPELLALLTGLTLALQDLCGPDGGAPLKGLGEADGKAALEVRALARVVLVRLKATWDELGRPIPLPELEAWLELSKLLVPREMPPSLAATWTELLPVSVPAPYDLPETQRLGDWLVLCGVLADFLPGLPEALGLGPAQVHVVGDFLRWASDDPASGEAALRVADAAAAVMPQLRHQAREVARVLRREAPGDVGIDPPDGVSSEEIDEPAPGFSVERVLADL